MARAQLHPEIIYREQAILPQASVTSSSRAGDAPIISISVKLLIHLKKKILKFEINASGPDNGKMVMKRHLLRYARMKKGGEARARVAYGAVAL